MSGRALAISRIQLSSMGVSTGPGVIVLTVMPVPASTLASPVLSTATAALVPP